MEKLLYRVEEVAELTGLGRTILYQLLRDGRLGSVRIGAARRIPRAALIQFVEQLSEEQVDVE
jgi:excisionase family DNA binding protein